MPRGISIHVGLNSVDPSQYGGWSGDLLACESDARDMAIIAQQSGFDANLILTAEATADRVLSAIASAATMLGHDDMFFLSYSGHGGQLPDTNGDEDDVPP